MTPYERSLERGREIIEKLNRRIVELEMLVNGYEREADEHKAWAVEQLALRDELIRDMYADLKTWRFVFVITANTERIAEVERFDERMDELGIEVEP